MAKGGTQMFDINESLTNWLEKLDSFKLSDYTKLPDIELYMDQIITLIDRHFSLFAYSSLDKMITSSMVNNYVKGEVIPAPISKRYNREHLALLEEVLTLKQVLSIAEVKQIIDSTYENKANAEVFNDFSSRFTEANKDAVLYAKEKLANINANDTASLNHLALELSLVANAYISIAKRILYYTKHYEIMVNQELEDKEKEKKKAEHKKKED